VALGQELTLIPPAEETRARREAYVTIAAHELAHHWYGDLVTMAWWDDTWLNEAFGTWEDAHVTEAVEPAWRALATARWSRRERALGADVHASARRLREPVVSRHEIEGAFDEAITYDKGSAVLSMFEGFLGAARFRAVVTAHLAARAHATATAADFLAALQAGAGQPVADAFRGFLDQPGVPLVQATVRCGPRGARALVRQERFLASAARDQRTGWTLPLCLKVGDAARTETVCALVAGPRAEVALPFCPAWIWPNAGGTGYHLSALTPADPPVLLPHLTAPEKLALATDAALLARRGDLPLGDALALVGPFARDPDRLVVEASVGLGALLAPDRLAEPELSRWRAWLRRTWGERARHLGWLPRLDDDEEARTLRRLLLPLVAGDGHDAVLAGEALALGRRFLLDRRQVPAEVGWPALEVASRHGDRVLFDQVQAEAGRAADRTERERLVALLGRFEAPALARAALEQVAAPGADLRDVKGILEASLAGRATRDLAWAFLVATWDGLAPRLRSDEGGWLVVQAAGVACDPRRKAEVAAFLRPRAGRFDGAPRALAVALEEVDACSAARARHAASVSRFLTHR
jgi:aminopeptidase N